MAVKDLCFEVIETCLNNCKFCSSNSDCNKKQIISFEKFKEVIDYFMSKGGIEELSLSGGEPFLHPEIIKMVEYAKSKGIRTVIFTSGVLRGRSLPAEYKDYYMDEMKKQLEEVEESEPDNEFSKECIRRHYIILTETPKYSPISIRTFLRLQELGLDKIVFDYQGYEYDTDQTLMGRNECARKAFLDSMLYATRVGMNTDIHFVPMKPNYKEIGDVLELLSIAGIKNISILKFLPQGRGSINKDSLELSDSEWTEFFKLLDAGKRYFSGNIRLGISLQGETTHKCNAGLEKLDIRFDGTVLPCPAFKEITLDECKKFNIKLPNIYENLNEVEIPGTGTRVKPLCLQIYNERAKKY